MRANGVFAFTTKAPPAESTGTVLETAGVGVFMHNRDYDERCAANHPFEPLKDLEFSMGDTRAGQTEFHFAIVFRKPAD
jgi:hypothetical protein